MPSDVTPQRPPKIGEGVKGGLRLNCEKLLRGLEQQYHSPILLVGIQPAGFEFFSRVSSQTCRRIREVDAVPSYAMDHGEMAMRPECDARKRRLLFEVIEGYL